MNSFGLVIDTEELSYTLHDQGCAQLTERSNSAKFVSLDQGNDDPAHIQKGLLPSWRFRPCDCLQAHERSLAAAG